jgi:tRNA-splicing ligase RtcB
MQDMAFAMRFAEENRARIVTACLTSLLSTTIAFPTASFERRIETHHNFASLERHLGKDVIVHRKGAVRTIEQGGSDESYDNSTHSGVTGAAVTIPGSMQTSSYIGMGQPNALALNTCAHGAGRAMGRNATRRANVGVNILEEMKEQGIYLICPPESDVLDEAGRAYKDIESVMQYQHELVTPAVKLRPLGVVKG